MAEPDITSSMEDYLEALLRLEKDRGMVRVKELAEHLGLTTATISSSIPRLRRLGLVEFQRYGPIKLTPLGRRLAGQILRREEVLVMFFHEVLGLPQDTAKREACLMEHALSDKSLEKLEEFVLFLKTTPEILEGWRSFQVQAYQEG